MKEQLANRPSLRIVAVMLAAMLIPTIASAHPDHGATSGFFAGSLHPWTGIDHIAAMFAAGLWSIRLARRSIAVLLAAAAVGIIGGTLIGVNADVLNSAEQIVAVSAIALGLIVATMSRVRVPLAAALIALFCFFHGYVHAIETPRQFSQFAFTSGFVFSMLCLQLIGVVVAMTVRRDVALRSVGAFCALGGLFALLAS